MKEDPKKQLDKIVDIILGKNTFDKVYLFKIKSESKKDNLLPIKKEYMEDVY